MKPILETFSLYGRTTLVTGGAGLFGRQIVEALAEAGATVVVTSRNIQSLDRHCTEWAKRGLRAHPASLDQADEVSILALRDKVTAEYGRLDVLVNNAVLRPMGDWGSDADQFAQSMAVNATGLFTITRVFGEHMAGHGGGSIIHIGSIQGMIGPDYTLYEGLGWGSPPDYFFHKGGMINFTRYVASRLGPKGVRCNTISPGGFFNDQDPRFVERYCKRTLLGRMANDHDLKGAIVFLASDASAYITGINLPVDAGYTAI
jgi:NAD(P)-dependent dehydrogenase (short-subunit alcohol dehydrogenase family)